MEDQVAAGFDAFEQPGDVGGFETTGGNEVGEAQTGENSDAQANVDGSQRKIGIATGTEG